MTDEQLEQIMKHIIKQMKSEGYNPQAQLKAYLLTDNEIYITRCGHARELIKKIEKYDIKRYLIENKI